MLLVLIILFFLLTPALWTLAYVIGEFIVLRVVPIIAIIVAVSLIYGLL